MTIYLKPCAKYVIPFHGFVVRDAHPRCYRSACWSSYTIQILFSITTPGSNRHNSPRLAPRSQLCSLYFCYLGHVVN